MPVILANKGKSAKEITWFDASPATVAISHRPAKMSDDDVRELCGAPTGATIKTRIENWVGTPVSSDKPPPGLYFYVSHPKWIDGHNAIGLINNGNFLSIYIKDVHFNDVAPKGIGALMIARIVRACLKHNLQNLQMLAAGGRLWIDMVAGQTPPVRWAGYYAWARCGFDMSIATQLGPLLNLFPNFPRNLASCTSVQDVIKESGGLDWWKAVGSGWFMAFDSSNPNTASISILEAYLKEKSL